MKTIIILIIATFLCSCEYIFKSLDGKCDHGWHTDYSEHPSNTRAYGRKIKVHIKNKTSTLYKNNGFYIGVVGSFFETYEPMICFTKSNKNYQYNKEMLTVKP